MNLRAILDVGIETIHVRIGDEFADILCRRSSITADKSTSTKSKTSASRRATSGI